MPYVSTTMKQNSAVMETPPDYTLIELFKQYWAAILFFAGVLGTILAFVKKVRTPVFYAFRWVRAAARLPLVLEGLERDNVLPDGVKVRDRLLDLSRMHISQVRWRRSMVDTLESPVFEADKDGNFVWANEALLSLTDLEIPQLVGKNWRNFIAGPDRRRIVDGWEAAVKDCSDFRDNFRMATARGEQWAIFNATCNKDDHGSVIDFVGKIKLIDGPTNHV